MDQSIREIPPMPFSKSYELVAQWGRDRGIIPNGTSWGQAKKTVEEAKELLDACEGRGPHTGHFLNEAERKAFVRDGVGDVLVTLVMVCELEDLSIGACFREAYEAIKDRRGQMGPDGIFYRVGQKMPNGVIVS